MRLAAELDGARLYQAAAYISMAADSILPPAQDDRSAGPGGAADATDLDFTLDEQDRVWMIQDGDCHVLGPSDAVCAEMRRFLVSVAAGGDGYG
jgi:hypothetical protein